MVSGMVDLGSHQLQRLVDLLTVHECEELLMTLSNPVENTFSQLNCLSEETNQFRQMPRTPRDTGIEILLLIFNKHSLNQWLDTACIKDEMLLILFY